MVDALRLDSGILGQIAHPRPNPEVAAWIIRAAGTWAIIVPEIADYEIRRELLRIRSIRGLSRLDRLGTTLGYAPLTTPIMRRAAQIWADARATGLPTAPPQSIDADVLLAATALELGPMSRVVVATTNVRHLNRFVDARRWEDVPV